MARYWRTKMKKMKNKKSALAKRRLTQKPTGSLSKPQTTVNPMAMVTIPYKEIQKPETYKGKLSVIPTPFNERQLGRMIAKTPQEIILSRKGKGGKYWDYIPTWWFKKQLNFTFGWMWDFDLLEQRIDGEFITVKGRLTIKNAKGEIMINKTDFGGHQVTFLSGKPHTSENYLDISNDFKSAASDCLKRCSVQLGFGLDVYSKSEYKTENGNLQPAEQPKAVEAQVIQTDYKAKLDTYLMDHPKGPFSAKEKIQFIKQKTGELIDYVKISQLDAQRIYAKLIQSK